MDPLTGQLAPSLRSEASTVGELGAIAMPRLPLGELEVASLYPEHERELRVDICDDSVEESESQAAAAAAPADTHGARELELKLASYGASAPAERMARREMRVLSIR